MRAALLRGAGEKLEVRDDFVLEGPGPGEVRVALAASGICHSDLSLQNGTVPVEAPCILGHEAAGEVVAVGEGVTSPQVGQPVVLAPLPPCGACFHCREGQPNLCTVGLAALTRRHFFLDGEPVHAGMGLATFAEETVVPAFAAIPIPEDVPLDLAALVGCSVMTGVGAVIHRAQVRPGSSVAVIGCGGVGSSVVQGAKLAGAAEIVAVDPLEAKREGMRRFGATHAVAPDGLAELSAELTQGRGFDYAFEVVGRAATLRAAWDATRRGGTTVVVGAPRVDEPIEFTAFELFYSEKVLVGCIYGSGDVRRDFPRLVRLWQQGRLDLEGLVSRRIDLGEINDAFAALERGEGLRSLIVYPQAADRQ